ncbi:MAG: hypothetical protein QXW79_00285 [Thermoplasmata archaeon]
MDKASVQNSSTTKTVAIVDFLNLVRKEISDRPDAKFNTVDEFIDHIREIARKIRKLNHFGRIYLVTKSFNFDKRILYHNIPCIIMWAFCTTIPEWTNRICLILVNGINEKDKEADDRSLFVLYNELTFTTSSRIIIISNDNFKNLRNHFLREVTLNFYWIRNVGEDWMETKLFSSFRGKFRQNFETFNDQKYLVVHLDTNKENYVSLSW